MIKTPYLGLVPAPSWTPADLPSLLVWQDGQNAGSVSVDGANQLITQTDQSGRGINWIPTVGAVAPTLIANALNGFPLFRLNSTDSLQTQTFILPFVPGWSYTGPLIEGYALRFTLPNGGSDQENILKTAASGVILQANETAGQNLINKNGDPAVPQLNTDLTGLAFGFLAGKWAGPICTTSGDPIHAIILNFKGTTYNNAKIYWQTPAQGSIPPYFATGDLTPFTHDLNDLGGATHFFSGLGTSGEIYVGEWFESIDDPIVGDFTSPRDYLLRRWFGTIHSIFLCFGDSLTKGFTLGQAAAYPYQLSLLQAGFDYLNVGINSRTIPLLIADQPAYTSLLRIGKANVPLIWAGTNDVELDVDSAATIFANLQTLCANFVSSGWSMPWVMPIIPRGTFSPSQNAKAAAFNALLPTGVGVNWVKVIPLTGDAAFNSPTTSWLNPVFYDPDTVHLTAAGYIRVATIVSANT